MDRCYPYRPVGWRWRWGTGRASFSRWSSPVPCSPLAVETTLCPWQISSQLWRLKPQPELPWRHQERLVLAAAGAFKVKQTRHHHKPNSKGNLGSNWPLPSSHSPPCHGHFVEPRKAMVSPYRVIEGDLAGGAPGHCAKTTPRGPSLLLEHVAALPQHLIFQQ